MTARRKSAKGNAKKEAAQENQLSDLEILEKLQQEILEKLKGDEFKPKVADFLRVLDFKLKLRLPSQEKQKLCDLIDQIRKEELTE